MATKQQTLGLSASPRTHHQEYKPFVPGPNPELADVIKALSPPYNPAAGNYGVKVFDKDSVLDKGAPPKAHSSCTSQSVAENLIHPAFSTQHREPGSPSEGRAFLEQRRPNQERGILAEAGGGWPSVEGIGEAAVEGLEPPLGAQKQDCPNGRGEEEE